MAPKSVTFRRHDHLMYVLFGDLLSHSYRITFSMFLYLAIPSFALFLLHSTAEHDKVHLFYEKVLLPRVCMRSRGGLFVSLSTTFWPVKVSIKMAVVINVQRSKAIT